MTVCSYYLRGACKYGDRCRNEHPGAAGTFGNQTWTSSNRITVPYTIETMTGDVTPLKDKPLWPLSSYGPSKYEPVVISGLDESPEELRVKAVTALKAGTTDEYIKYEGEKTTAADQMYTNARNNVRQLYEQALKASSPAQSSTNAPEPTSATSAPSTFGTPSVFGGTTTTTFGKPTFGQPAFGQTGFGGGTSAFSQTAPGTTAFGAPAQQPSAFGQPSQATSAFGQPAQTTSAFGQVTQPTSAFAQPSTQPPQPISAFGQSSQFGSAFGQSTSAFSPATQPSSAFGQPSQPAFGQSSLIKPASGAFGAFSGGGGFSAFASQPSSFASASAAPASPTISTTPTQPAFVTNPPIHSAFGTITSTPRSAFATTNPPSPFGGGSMFNNTLAVPTATSPASAMMGGGSPFALSPMTVTPSTEKPVSGAPDFASAKLVARMKPGADRYLELLPHDYDEMLPVDVKAAFASTKFEWGKVPDWIPPEQVR